MKVILNEIENNLQGTNSGGDEAKNQINDLKHKEGKKHAKRTRRERQIQKNKDRLRSL